MSTHYKYCHMYKVKFLLFSICISLFSSNCLFFETFLVFLGLLLNDQDIFMCYTHYLTALRTVYASSVCLDFVLKAYFCRGKKNPKASVCNKCSLWGFIPKKTKHLKSVSSNIFPFLVLREAH